MIVSFFENNNNDSCMIIYSVHYLPVSIIDDNVLNDSEWVCKGKLSSNNIYIKDLVTYPLGVEFYSSNDCGDDFEDPTNKFMGSSHEILFENSTWNYRIENHRLILIDKS